jgi:pyruvate/2-oxoglutarate dehydrogenase complex dihydrolipoamide dehydrogenase (E3) component
MPADYTLTIIGNTPIARYAAIKASQLGARTALIDRHRSPHQVDPNLGYDALIQLRQIARGNKVSQHLGYPWQPQSASLNWTQFKHWLSAVTEQIQIEQGRSPDALAAAGIDVVLADDGVNNGAFVRRPQLSFLVNERLLRSRTFLLAPAVTTTIPNIEGITTVPHATLDTLFDDPFLNRIDHPNHPFPRRWIILGNDPRAIQLAQSLNHFGVQVTMLLTGDRLLPYEDLELSHWLQLRLTTEGITIVPNTFVQRVERSPTGLTGFTVVSTRGEFVADFLWIGDRGDLNFSDLNLAAVGVEPTPRLQVNSRLQTTNPRIYACGESLGGYPFAAIAQHEADVAIHNVLSLLKHKVNYAAVPWMIQTDPAIARVGLTEQQARQQYGDEVVVLRRSLKGLAIAELTESSGFFKIILRHNGEILGAHGVGLEVAELVQVLSLMMQSGQKFQAGDRSYFTSDICRELLLPMVQQWQVERLARWQYDWRSAWWEWWRGRTHT